MRGTEHGVWSIIGERFGSGSDDVGYVPFPRRLIKMMADSFRGSTKRTEHRPTLQAAEAVRLKQEEHEEQRQRVAESLAVGGRLSRKRRP